ncbi:unnamed protein product, partial [Rotaria socialis]
MSKGRHSRDGARVSSYRKEGVEHVLMTPSANVITIMLTQEQQLFSSIKDTISMVDKNDDLAKLSLLTEDILLEHLKHRYDKNLIYTYLGDILVAVNPFHETNLYTTQIRDFYRYSTDIQKPPHVYALVDLVYRNVCHGIYKQQCCVISGESGSGKTESTKLFLKQLMYLCGGSSQLEQQILQATPLLESFGNAQTVMNNNSSRFGKYIALKFINGKVVGAQISDYLLEKSRVVIQSPGERNFHIFYYLFDYLPLETKQILCLRTKHDYKYLLTNPSLDVQNTTAMNSLDEVINAMSLLNFTDKVRILKNNDPSNNCGVSSSVQTSKKGNFGSFGNF